MRVSCVAASTDSESVCVCGCAGKRACALLRELKITEADASAGARAGVRMATGLAKVNGKMAELTHRMALCHGTVLTIRRGKCISRAVLA